MLYASFNYDRWQLTVLLLCLHESTVKHRYSRALRCSNRHIKLRNCQFIHILRVKCQHPIIFLLFIFCAPVAASYWLELIQIYILHIDLLRLRLLSNVQATFASMLSGYRCCILLLLLLMHQHHCSAGIDNIVVCSLVHDMCININLFRRLLHQVDYKPLV
jgi:hypothetical protein